MQDWTYSKMKSNDKNMAKPFAGSGTVLFWILQEFPNITRAVINDINPELIYYTKTQ